MGNRSSKNSKKIKDLKDPKDSKSTVLINKLLRTIRDEGIALFHDQFNEPHALLSNAQVVRMRSRAFSRWLADFVFQRLHWAPTVTMFQTILQLLEGQAQCRGERIELQVRVAEGRNCLYYDLGDGKAVLITPKEWRIVGLGPKISDEKHETVEQSSPILFRRFAHQKPQVKPKPKGDLRSFLELVNLPQEGENREKGLLLLVWLVTAFIPGFPHPILALYGPQGSAKSTLFKLLKELIDPCAVQSLAPSYNPSDFALQASHHWFLPLDNLSEMPMWLSNALCRTCTGEAFSRRQLFEDVEETIFSFQRVIGLGGINLVAYRPDLLDRCLLLGLEQISDSSRRLENEMWERFVKVKPLLLGAIFDAVVGALQYYPDVKLTELPRMADFARWGVAVALALGYKAEEFLSAYKASISRQHREAINANLVAQAIVEMMKTKAKWEGTPSQLLGVLFDAAIELNIDTRIPSWPKEPNWVWRRLNEARTNLEAVGIKVEKGEDEERYIKIWKTGVGAEGVADKDGNPAASQRPQPTPDEEGDKS